ncbi:13957_t:CDS:2 [Gigaspora margarita]|uniref:13957_t:CDS:1 n=1 Tax=Gigaspora margarita TaxID=4874 RepID=A0ABM8W0V6_GIGMA|nr:13957_t:CDS:2 [Gigaspora margarita]
MSNSKEILEIYDDATHQNPTSQIDDSENKIIDDNSESSKVNEQLSEIQVEADDQQEQSDDSPPPEKNSKPLRVNKPTSLNISHKKKKHKCNTPLHPKPILIVQDESTSSDAAIEELQISSKLSQR